MMSYGLVEVRCCCRHRDGFRPRGICNARNHIHINSRTQSHIYLSECVAHIVYCIYRLCKNWVERTVRIGYRREMSTALQWCICSVWGNAQWCLAWSADGVSQVCICAMFILYGLHQSCVASSIDEVQEVHRKAYTTDTFLRSLHWRNIQHLRYARIVGVNL